MLIISLNTIISDQTYRDIKDLVNYEISKSKKMEEK
jgi:hypothetical protein